MKIAVREVHPLKEGLRPLFKEKDGINGKGQRGTSIKRRIKTTSHTCHRIESFRVREVHPLKEGLRLSIPPLNLLSMSQRGTSIKRRIKTHLQLVN